MDLQFNDNEMNRKLLQFNDNEMNRKLLQFIGKEMNELDDKIRLLKKENDLLKKEIENLQHPN
jgi:hypothetical protein